MSDLTGFLLARLAEDQAVAERAFEYGSREWHLDDLNETVLWWPPEPHVAETERKHGMRVVSDRWRGETIDDRHSPHIARWDPARVLAECEAKRRLVELHKLVPVNFGDEYACTTCSHSKIDRPCETLKTLALAYAEHPDYREEWRP